MAKVNFNPLSQKFDYTEDTASNVNITDSGNYYTGTEVETALQEIGADLGAVADEKAKVSANDTTAGYLNGKLTAGASISLTEGNNGGDETLAIANTAPDQTVALTAGSGMNVSGTYPNFTLKVAYTNIITVDAAGTGDYTTITAALAAITPTSSNPYLIRVLKGTYVEEFNMKSYVKIQGSGMEHTVIKMSNVQYQYGALNVLTGIDNIEICDLTLWCDTPGYYPSRIEATHVNTVFTNVLFKSTGGAGFGVYGDGTGAGVNFYSCKWSSVYDIYGNHNVFNTDFTQTGYQAFSYCSGGYNGCQVYVAQNGTFNGGTIGTIAFNYNGVVNGATVTGMVSFLALAGGTMEFNGVNFSHPNQMSINGSTGANSNYIFRNCYMAGQFSNFSSAAGLKVYFINTTLANGFVFTGPLTVYYSNLTVGGGGFVFAGGPDTFVPYTSYDGSFGDIYAGHIALKSAVTNPTSIPMVAKGASAQSANLHEWQNSSGTPLSYVDAIGNIVIDSDSYGVKLGADQDILLTSDSAGKIILTPAADTDIAMSFVGTTTSGELKWMEDEDYFSFTDGILVNDNLAVTIPNTGNVVGITVTQNDTTNNPRGVSITNAGTATSLFVDPNGTASTSTSVGGAILLENTGNTGAGFIIYSNAGASTGRLMNIRADNAAFDQAALHIDYDGTANAFEVINNSTDSSSNGFSITSTNENDSAVGFSGKESGKGTLKITHTLPSVADTNASAISIQLNGTGTACQGVFMDTDTGVTTTGNLLNLRNIQIARFVVTSTGNTTIGGGVDGEDYTLTFNGNAGDGVLTWMEDEDYFQFSDDIYLVGGENIVLSATTGTKIGTATTQLLGFYNATPVDQPAALTAGLTTITHSEPGTPDYAIADLTQTTPYGFVSADEGQTVLKVIANLQTKVAELESRLEELGLIASN